jgi:hypothetical protein
LSHELGHAQPVCHAETVPSLTAVQDRVLSIQNLEVMLVLWHMWP